MDSASTMNTGLRPFFRSFEAFIEAGVLPLQSAHPAWIRFDGQRSGGNRTPVGYFVSGDGIWRVHADTWFRPLLIAYEAGERDPSRLALVVEETSRSRSKCLVLRPDLRGWNRFKHLYVYWHGPYSQHAH
jgi:hypothetical protein